MKSKETELKLNKEDKKLLENLLKYRKGFSVTDAILFEILKELRKLNQEKEK